MPLPFDKVLTADQNELIAVSKEKINEVEKNYKEFESWAEEAGRLNPWTTACQAPLSMEFSRQECWHGQPFPSSRDLPN